MSDEGRDARARVLQNTASTARDHLANERTFLAWTRTALGMIGLGVLLEKLVAEGGMLVTVGALTLLAYGGAMLIYAVIRYEHIGRCLRKGTFPVAQKGPMALGLVALAIAGLAVAFVLAG